MAERVSRRTAGKAWRVLGVFLYMLGAGIVLECDALWRGTLVMLSGATAVTWGALVGRAGRPVAAVGEPAHPEGQPTEGHA